MSSLFLIVVIVLPVVTSGCSLNNRHLFAAICVDGSSSIATEEFNKANDFVKNFGRAVPLDATDGIGVSIFLFSDDVDSGLSSSRFTISGIDQVVDQLYARRTFGNTHIENCIADASTRLQGIGGSIPKVMVLVSDGEATAPTAATTQANLAKANGIRILAASLDDSSFLQTLVSVPSTDVFSGAPTQQAVDSWLSTITDDCCCVGSETTTEQGTSSTPPTPPTPSTPPTTPTSGPPNIPTISPCESCVYHNGVYVAPHESQCCMFYQCDEINNNWVEHLKSCPPGQFWNIEKLTCTSPVDAQCIFDPCFMQPDGTKHADACSCDVGFTCKNQLSIALPRCPNGQSYNPAASSCVTDSTCTRPTTQAPTTCSNTFMKEKPGDDTKWIWDLGNGQTRIMDCPSGTYFNTNKCLCDNRHQVQCSASTDIDFTTASFGENFENVEHRIEDGRDVGFFSGANSRIMLRQYANMGHIDYIKIEITFKETFADNSGNYILFSNCDCASGDACSIRAYMNRAAPAYTIYDQADTLGFPQTTLSNSASTGAGAWKTHIYEFDAGVLTNTIVGDDTTTSSTIGGKLENRHPSIHIGDDGCQTTMNSFVGYIDHITIFRCKP